MTPARDKVKSFGKQVALGIGFIGVGAVAVLVGVRAGTVLSDRSPSATLQPPEFSALPSGRTNFIVEAVRRVEASVVRIETTTARSVPNLDRSPRSPRSLPPLPDFPPPTPQGSGSGFAIDSSGRIMTNAHVVGEARDVEVILPTGRRLPGTVLGVDPLTDVAVVEIDGPTKNDGSPLLPAIPLGNSQRLKAGEWAIAIGNPMGLDRTVTVGIISAIDRSSRDIGVPDKRVGFLQTDAAINPGNSGGPLLNAAGEAIGMNTAIIDGAQGLGFAIPIETALRVARQIVETGRAEHPYLGIQMLTLEPEMDLEDASHPLIPEAVSVREGVLIVRAIEDSPADKAGLKKGDVIRKMNGQTVMSSETVQQIVRDSRIGEAISMEVLRGEETVTLEVRPGELPL
ncbi:trypsin-like peptidase domain-containing protein [Baaleninema sp.]|uniref:trypsin-like peptidase domain-containing protein n=1 Tax=Baaleninema sp. TaxID=3101197 RepID=UPI003CFCC77E